MFLSGALNAQFFEWGAIGTGPSTGVPDAIATDPDGNTFISGYFISSFRFESFSFPSPGIFGGDYFLVKFTPTGKVEWVRTAQGAVGYALTTDAEGNSYVTGRFAGTHPFFYDNKDTIKLKTTGATDVFIAKYSPTGKLLWINSQGTKSCDEGRAIFVDGDQNVYVSGEWSMNCGLAPPQIFIAKHDNQGNLLWRKLSNFNSGTGLQMTINRSGQLVVNGVMRDSLYLDGLHMAEKGLRFFSATFTTTGKIIRLWGDYGNPYGMCMDKEDNVIVTGYFREGMIIGGKALHQEGLDVYNKSGMYLAKYDADGNPLWVETSNAWSGIDVVAGSNGNIYVTGMMYRTGFPDSITVFGRDLHKIYLPLKKSSTDVYIARYSPEGIAEWAINPEGPKEYRNGISAISTDFNGSIFITGSFTGTIAVNGQKLTSDQSSHAGAPDVFLLKLTDTAEVRPKQYPKRMQLLIYPNPSAGEFSVELDAPVKTREVKIFNPLGQMIRKFAVKGSSFTVNRLESGVYFLTVQDGEEVVTEKVVVR